MRKSESNDIQAKKYCKVNIVCDGSKDGKFTQIPPVSDWKLSPDSAYLYYCANETVDGKHKFSESVVLISKGIEFQSTPAVPENVLLVADVSSNFISRPIGRSDRMLIWSDVSKHALIYAGAQKNAGIAGVTIVIGSFWTYSFQWEMIYWIDFCRSHPLLSTTR